MNKFFRTFWAALLAFISGSILFTMLGFMIFSGIVASFSSKPVAVQTNSVLKIDLSQQLSDSPDNNIGMFDLSSMTHTPSVTLLNVLNAIETAASDFNIKGIYLNIAGAGNMSISQAEEIRDAIVKFKESGKFVIAYNDSYSQAPYYLSSVADKVFINPDGMFLWQGLSGTVMFYKGLLEKLDIQVEILRHGTFKAAVEPYMLDKMSPENRLQMNTYVNSLWNILLTDISESRGISVGNLNKYANTLAVKTPAEAKKLGFIDEILYKDQVMNVIAELVKGNEIEDYTLVEEQNTPNFVKLTDYIANNALSNMKFSKNQVAVVYADGNIVDGKSEKGTIGGETLAAKLAKVRKNDNVKAVVLRVNSPGGSAQASEIIWREMELLREKKPVIVSMGSYAASGGYWISSGADMIIADRSTLTGSIGVFGMMMNLGNTMKNKLGITTDVVKTNTYADMGNQYRAMQGAERAFFMNNIEKIYAKFLDHVSAGRNMTTGDVDKIGQGRVWLGTDAKSIGLVDGFGGLKDAIALAADRVGIADDYRVYEVADEANPFNVLMNSLSGVRSSAVETELGDAFKHYNEIMTTLSETGVQARMPYIIEVN